jgi:hypothetical protein
MMQAMHQMKSPPLIDREGAEKGMIENFDAPTELGGASGEELIHLGNLGQNFGQDFLPRESPGPCLRRRFPSLRQIVEPENDERLGTVFPSRLRPKRFTAIDQSRESFERSGVRQVKMLEDFCRRPFARRVPAQLLGRQTRDGGFDLSPQSSEMRVHAGYSPFAIFQLECCRTNNLNKLYQEGCHENG